VDCAILAIGALYWAGSRDALRNYYSRTEVLLGTREREVDDDERPLHGKRADEQAEGGGEEPGDNEASSEPQDS